MQPRAVHTVSQSTRLSSKSGLTSELDPVPARPPPEHPACPPHPRPACPGPWKSPSLSGPQVLSWGQAREEARWAVRIGQGGGERGGPAEPTALSPQPRPPWPPDPPRSSVAPSASSGPLHYPRSLSLLCSPSSSAVSASFGPLSPPWPPWPSPPCVAPPESPAHLPTEGLQCQGEGGGGMRAPSLRPR